MLQVNNAGSSQPKGVLNVDVEDLEQMLDVHLKGTFNITQRALRAITKSKGQWQKIFYFQTFSAFCS